jgi:hypothetical protein
MIRGARSLKAVPLWRGHFTLPKLRHNSASPFLCAKQWRTDLQHRKWYGRTVVIAGAPSRMLRMPEKPSCAELERFKREAAAALLEAKKTRRTRDLTIYEDAELSRESHRRIDALIKHLLAGHDGGPCPAGDRPIVKKALTSESSFTPGANKWRVARKAG